MELPEYEHEWVVVSDGSGKTVTMRYLATVEYSGKTYFILSNTENEDTFEFADESSLLLVREELTPDGALEYVVAHEEEEIEQVFGQYVMDSLMEEIEDPCETEETWACGENHCCGEFCYCGESEYLQ